MISMTTLYNGSSNEITLYDNHKKDITLDTSGNNDAYIVKYNDSGYAQWATRISGSGNDFGMSITTDMLNNIYVTGYYTSTLTIYNTDGTFNRTLDNPTNTQDVFIVKYIHRNGK